MTARKERNLRLIEGKWYLDFTFRGQRVRKFGGFTKDQAKVALAKERLDRRDIELGLKKAPDEDVSFATFADEFLKIYCKPNKRSWRQDELSLESLKVFFKGETLRSIGPALIERYKAERKVDLAKNTGNTVSPATVNRALALLKTLFAKAVEWDRLETNPAVRVKKLKEPPGRERVATPDEVRRLVEASDSDVRPVIITALGTGMRKGEILGLLWTDLDFVRGVISIRMSKSGKSRKVPMSGNVAAALGAVPRRGEFVFWNEETRTHLKDVKTAFRAACARAKKDADDEKDPGIVGLRFHDLRHTFASRALELGADLVSVSKILGHASITMTAKYLHASGESQRLAVEKVAGFLDPTRQKVDTPSEAVSAAPSVSASKRDN